VHFCHLSICDRQQQQLFRLRSSLFLFCHHFIAMGPIWIGFLPYFCRLFAFVFSLGCVYLCSHLPRTFDGWILVLDFYIHDFFDGWVLVLDFYIHDFSSFDHTTLRTLSKLVVVCTILASLCWHNKGMETRERKSRSWKCSFPYTHTHTHTWLMVSRVKGYEKPRIIFFFHKRKNSNIIITKTF
jgi:hypothetical protein